jgi:hypothetical protein
MQLPVKKGARMMKKGSRKYKIPPSFLELRSTDQLILRRVIAKGTLDRVAYTFDLVPHTAVDDIALVALASQLRFQCNDLRVERRRRADFGGEGSSRQCAKCRDGRDLVPTSITD